MKTLFYAFLVSVFCFFHCNANTQPKSESESESSQKKGIYVIFDASGSMWGKLADQSFKIEVAKQVLQDFVQTDLGDVELAFRAYGHNRKGDCRDSELLVPFGNPQQVIASLQSKIKGINPIGKTPITYSFKEALKDFGGRGGDIILISDGIETCDEDPCELIKMWRKTNVNIKVHVVGLGLDEVSRPAMKCIAEASETEFQDAANASDLAEGLKKIHEQSSKPYLTIEGFDAHNQPISVKGFLSQNGQKLGKVNGENKFYFPEGEYLMTIGVETQNGNLYKPIRQPIYIAGNKNTHIKTQVIRPPSVKAKFIEEGKTERGANIYAYQNDQEVFRFRWIDQVFVDEGTYEFRTQPNSENALKLTESFAGGEHKELVFEMVNTVHVYFKMLASQSGIRLNANYHLLQNGEVKYKVHSTNGKKILPGLYDVELLHREQPYIQKNVNITPTDEGRTFTFEIPVGHVTFRYQNADGSPADDKRCFAGRIGKKKYFQRSGKKYPYIPGTYVVEGWQGAYDLLTFEVKLGEEKEVILRAKK